MSVGLSITARDARADHTQALDLWRTQETAGEPDSTLLAADSTCSDTGAMPSGWWILPMFACALGCWGLLIWSFFGA